MANKRRHIIPRLFWYTAAVLGIYFLLSTFNILPSIGDIFKSKPVTIDNTASVITQTKTIAQLMTVAAYNEVVVDTVKITENTLPIKILTRLPATASKLVLIARGRIIAGCNLEKLKPEHIFIKKDSVSVKLPAAEILDVIVNPSDFEVFTESGTWSTEEVTALKTKAKTKIQQVALQQNILTKANEQAKLVMKNFMESSGFKKVTVYQ